MNTTNDQQMLDAKLRNLPKQELLALAPTLHLIAKAQIASGKRLGRRELLIFNEGTDALRRSNLR